MMSYTDGFLNIRGYIHKSHNREMNLGIKIVTREKFDYLTDEGNGFHS